MKLKPVFDGHSQLCGYAFHCPGCEHTHVFFTAGRMTWDFNADLESPTFTPSLLNRCETHQNPKLRVCHLNLTAGKLHFHPDCTHDLAGQVVDLPEPWKED
jgi:hypothetical protein